MRQTSKTKLMQYVIASLILLSAQQSQEVCAAQTYSPFYTGGQSIIQQNSTSNSAGTKNRAASVLEIEAAAETAETHPFAGSEREMEELDKLEPINTNLQAAVDVHNLISQLKNFKNVQKQYDNMVKLHERSLELLKNSEQCTIDYMGRYFKEPIKVWSGKDLRDMPENHDLRQGLSAWAISMFETAKAAEVSPIDSEDVISLDMDTSKATQEELLNLEEVHSDSEETIDNLEEQTQGIYFKEPSRQEELEEEDRKTDLMSKDIGTEVALWMADYLSGENTNSGTDSPSWNSADLGGVKQRFPVWTDQKTFYGQYLIRKYKNIKNYIKNYTIPENVKQKIVDKVFDRQKQYMNIAEEQITQAAIEARLTAQKTYDDSTSEERQEYEAKLSAIESSREAKVSALQKELDEKIAIYNQEIAAINEKRDAYMSQMSDIDSQNSSLSQEINRLRQEINNYDSILASATVSEEQKQEYETLKKQVEEEISEAEAKIENQKAIKADLQKLYEQETTAKEKKEQDKTDYESQIQVQIGEANKQATEEKDLALKEYQEKTSDISEELEEKIAQIDAAEIAAKAAINSKSMITAKQIINQSDFIIEDAKEIAYENIDKTLQALKALGDELYRGQIQSTIESYHQALIDSLKGQESQIAGVKLEAAAAKVHDLTNFNVDIVISSFMDEQMRILNLNNYRDMVKNTSILLEVPLFDEMLDGVYTGADSQYFVGSQPKEQDFAAPKAMPDYNLPPLREYVRLDYIDLQNIGKDTAQMEVGHYEIVAPTFNQTGRVWVKTEDFPISIIDKEKFLNYGGRIPEIWKLMLKDKAFVDSDFYLTSDMVPAEESDDIPAEYNPLSLGGEMSPLYRGGIYPCVLKNIESEKGVCTASGTIENGTGIVDVAIIDKGRTNSKEYFMGLSFVTGSRREELQNQSLPVCQEVSAKCKIKVNGNTIETSPYLTLVNKEESTGNTSDSFVEEGQASELGSIINIYSGKMLSNGSFVENVFGYSPYMQSVVNYGKRMEELSEDDDADDLSAKEQQNDDIYVRAQYNNNQVGDFLDHVELEQKFKQALDDMEETVKENQEVLYTELKKFGYEPSEDFNIGRDEDYDLTVKQLKTIKSNYMNQAKGSLDSLETGNSDFLSDSKSSYQRVYQGLLLDSDCVVSMTMDVDNISEFSEKIKTATVNNTVDESYEKNGDEDFEETLKSMKPAYCAAY